MTKSSFGNRAKSWMKWVLGELAQEVKETFEQEVARHQKQQLEEVALSGERVNLYFVKRYMTFPWRGDTKYFITKVERAGN